MNKKTNTVVASKILTKQEEKEHGDTFATGHKCGLIDTRSTIFDGLAKAILPLDQEEDGPEDYNETSIFAFVAALHIRATGDEVGWTDKQFLHIMMKAVESSKVAE